MKGYKGFNKGLICKGKQYAENTVFEEYGAEICERGMHFCENPFDVLYYYSFVDNNGELNEFAEVEALAETKADGQRKKFCTTRIKIGAKLSIVKFVDAFVNFTLSKIKAEETATNTGYKSAATNTGDKSAATNTGNWSAATNTGDWSAATNTGDKSAATNTGDWSAATNTGNKSAASVEGKESFAIATGMNSKAKGALGCYIALAEWVKIDDNYKLADFRAIKVDGEVVKADTWYQLKNGEFIEVGEWF